MTERQPYRAEDGGVDALDVFVDASKGGAFAAVPSWRRVPVALLLAAPALWLVPVGWLLGPSGLALVTTELVVRASPLLSVAMAALGVFVGLGLRLNSPGERRLLLASTAEATIVMTLVAGAGAVWVVASGTAPTAGLLVALGATAIAAAASTPLATARGLAFARLADLDDVVPILLGALLLAVVEEATLTRAFIAVGQSATLALLFAAAGWLLLRGSHGEAERVTVVAGLLLLLGGAAQYLQTPALLTGLAAGAFWSRAPGEEFVRRYLDPIQRPVVVLLVVAAGSLVTLDLRVVVAASLFAALRLAGKLLGSRVAGRILGLPAPDSLGRLLVWPGVIGLAFLVNVARLRPADSWLELAFGAVTVGTVLGELAALWLSRGEAEAA
jgi:hypothetical protein